LRIAAGVFLVVGSGALIYYFNSVKPEMLALERTKTDSTEATTPLSDSSSTLLSLAKDVSGTSDGTPVTPSPTVKQQRENPVSGVLGKASGGAEKTDASPKAEESDQIAAATVEEEAEVASDPIQNEKTERTAAERKRVTPAFQQKVSAQERIVSGKVSSAEDGLPLPGATIIVSGTSSGTATDQQGEYSIALPSGTKSLSYSFMGMESKEIKVPVDSRLDVQLSDDPAQLSEVVVRGQPLRDGAQEEIPKPAVRLAFPAGGIRAYNKYLERSLQYPKEALAQKIKGKVTIGFVVTTSGSLRDFTVVRGLGYGCDEEVIRLVQEGPAWSPSFENDKPVESEVRVKLKFDPEKAKD